VRSVGRDLAAWAAALLVLATTGSPAFAGSSMRCGNRLVEDGASIPRVLHLCGDPEYRTTAVEYVKTRLPGGDELLRPVLIESWTYNFGPRQFVRYLTFYDGQLVDVSQGGYGY